MKAPQSCLTLFSPMDYTVNGILQARTLEWVAIPSSRGFPNPRIELRSPTLQEILYRLSHQKPQEILLVFILFLDQSS